MFKLIALLCAAMFTVLLIGGEDRGQLRPGLENAPIAAAEPAEQAPVQVAATPVAASDAAPADVASVSAPVTVDPATTAETEAAITETVFSLANYSDEVPVQAAPVDPQVDPQTAGDLAYVDAGSVNVREGPGTDNPVLAKLTRGEAVTIVSTDDTGWARIRLEGDGLEGFMSMEYLSATAP